MLKARRWECLCTYVMNLFAVPPATPAWRMLAHYSRFDVDPELLRPLAGVMCGPIVG